MSSSRVHVFRRPELLQASQALKFRRVHHSDAARVQLDVAEDRVVKNLGLVLWWWRRLGAGALPRRRGHAAGISALCRQGALPRPSGGQRRKNWCGALLRVLAHHLGAVCFTQRYEWPTRSTPGS